jgi:hypothetical protein
MFPANWFQTLTSRVNRSTARRARPGWRLLRLEDRLAPATFTVLNTDDAGAGSLRQAILNANASAGADSIAFNIPGGGVHTISPLSALPAMTDATGIVLDGYSQPGSSPNTLAVGDNAVLAVELDGSLAGSGAIGLSLTSDNNTIRGLVINRFSSHGISITGNSTGNAILGSFMHRIPRQRRPRHLPVGKLGDHDRRHGTGRAQRHFGQRI